MPSKLLFVVDAHTPNLKFLALAPAGGHQRSGTRWTVGRLAKIRRRTGGIHITYGKVLPAANQGRDFTFNEET